jgi:hypothetical protein
MLRYSPDPRPDVSFRRRGDQRGRRTPLASGPGAIPAVESVRAGLGFGLRAQLTRQRHPSTGIVIHSGQGQRSARWARSVGEAGRRLFVGTSMPNLTISGDQVAEPALN